MTLKDGTLIPIDPDQILLRGSCLRNCEWVIGVCIYSGHDTKIMKNGTSARSKVSKIARQTNIYIVVTMLIQLTLSIIAAASTAMWTYFRADKYWYIYPLGDNDGNGLMLSMLIDLGVWFIALQNFVPVSLLITLELVNFLQAYFITQDINMCDEKRGL